MFWSRALARASARQLVANCMPRDTGSRSSGDASNRLQRWRRRWVNTASSDWRRDGQSHDSPLLRLPGNTLAILRYWTNSEGMAPTALFHRLDFGDWQRTMDVNVNGVFHCTQVALEYMLSAGWGRIINIASVASLRGFPYVSGYCASKHAVLGLTRAVALEVATQGITVNAICPGYADTARGAVAEIVSKTGRTSSGCDGALHRKQPSRASD